MLSSLLTLPPLQMTLYSVFSTSTDRAISFFIEMRIHWPTRHITHTATHGAICRAAD